MQLQAEKWIDAPPGAVADLLCDLRRRPEWAVGSARLEAAAGATGAVGDRYTEHLSHDSIKIQLAGEVLEAGPERFGWVGKSDSVHFDRTLLLTPEGRGTRVAASYGVEFKSLALALMEKRIRPILESMLASDLDALERLAKAP